MNTLPRVPAVHANVALKSGCVGGGLGVVATGPIKAGELIERCILTRLLESYPGHDDPHVFVWWKGPPGTTYAHSGTGQSTAEEGKWEPPKLRVTRRQTRLAKLLSLKRTWRMAIFAGARVPGTPSFTTRARKRRGTR